MKRGRKPNKIKVVCEYCEKIFELNPHDIKEGRRFCSRKCVSLWRSLNWRGKNNSQWKGGKVEIACKYCGNLFKIKPSIIKMGRGKFCSRKCDNLYRSKNHFKKINTNKYVILNIYGKKIPEHRIIWEKANNKTLSKNMVIHHLNGIKTDNRPKNLVAMKKCEHINQTKPYKKRIKELEEIIKNLNNQQGIF